MLADIELIIDLIRCFIYGIDHQLHLWMPLKGIEPLTLGFRGLRFAIKLQEQYA